MFPRRIVSCPISNTTADKTPEAPQQQGTTSASTSGENWILADVVTDVVMSEDKDIGVAQQLAQELADPPAPGQE